jgi:acyl-CoA reductase-like NAD-dependent aldehyde dehydrogenase
MISAEARRRFLEQVERAIEAGAELRGADPRVPLESGSLCRPTVLLGRGPEPERALEGVFGPVVIVREVADLDAAVAAVNASEFGLSVSLWGRDRAALARLAARLDVGMVTINDAVTPAGHMTAPFGGLKASGFGRTRGPAGLAEFVQHQAVHVRGAGGFRPQLYPYRQTAGRLSRLLRMYRGLFHRPAR